VLKSFD